MFPIDTVRRDTAILVAALLAGGDADDGLTPEDLAPVVQPGTGPGQEGIADTKTAEVSADAGEPPDDRDDVSVAGKPGEDTGVTSGQPRVATEPDRAAHAAAGPVGALGDAIAAQLLDMADDGHDAAFRRLDAVLALRTLIPRLPASTCSLIARRLLTLHLEPRFSVTDASEFATHDRLNRGHIETGARTMPARALRVAAEAYARAHLAGADDAALASELVARAERLLRDDDVGKARQAAIALAALAPVAAVDARVLAAHADEQVRAVATKVWVGRGGQPPDLLARLAEDSSARVRTSVAACAAEAARLVPESEDYLAQLRKDPSFSVRAVLSTNSPRNSSSTR